MPIGIGVEVAAFIVVIVFATLALASAIQDHAQAVRETHRLRPAPLPVTDSTWRIVVAQLAVDVLNEPFDVCSFSSMQVLNQGRWTAWIRFVLHDGRALVFATARVVPGCKGRGRRVNMQSHPQSSCELHQLWLYFMTMSGQAAPVSRDADWFVLPLQSPQDKLGRSVILRNHNSYQSGLIGRFGQFLLPKRR